MRIFRIDSPFMQKLNGFADFLLINTVYLICCLPIFTIGAAKSALYAAAFSYIEQNDWGVRIFLRKFRENFRSITPLYLLLLLIGLFLAFDLYVVIHNQFALYQLFVVILAILCVVFLLITTQVFLLQAKFVCRPRQLFANALLTALAHPIRTIIIAILELLPWLMFAWDPYLLFQIMPVFLFIYYSIVAWFATKLMRKTFQRYAGQHDDLSEEIKESHEEI